MQGPVCLRGCLVADFRVTFSASDKCILKPVNNDATHVVVGSRYKNPPLVATRWHRALDHSWIREHSIVSDADSAREVKTIPTIVSLNCRPNPSCWSAVNGDVCGHHSPVLMCTGPVHRIILGERYDRWSRKGVQK